MYARAGWWEHTHKNNLCQEKPHLKPNFLERMHINHTPTLITVNIQKPLTFMYLEKSEIIFKKRTSKKSASYTIIKESFELWSNSFE